jgi:hypothetical protein
MGAAEGDVGPVWLGTEGTGGRDPSKEGLGGFKSGKVIGIDTDELPS